MAVSIQQKELRNNVGKVLRRAEDGEELTITVSGRPVARLGPIEGAQWVSSKRLGELWREPADPTFGKDLERMGGEMVDPWTE
jgi:prevent-host-death family protein